ncbi:MAG: PorT family protein [Prevotella sp.]|nr:PorT family protein [Prevotella sp.]
MKKEDELLQDSEKWIHQLQSRMAGHEEPAPEGLWEDIESALPAHSVAKKARVVAWRRWAAAAAATLLLGGAGVVYFTTPDKQESVAENTPDNLPPLGEDSREYGGTEVRRNENRLDKGNAAKETNLVEGNHQNVHGNHQNVHSSLCLRGFAIPVSPLSSLHPSPLGRSEGVGAEGLPVPTTEIASVQPDLSANEPSNVSDKPLVSQEEPAVVPERSSEAVTDVHTPEPSVPRTHEQIPQPFSPPLWGGQEELGRGSFKSQKWAANLVASNIMSSSIGNDITSLPVKSLMMAYAGNDNGYGYETLNANSAKSNNTDFYLPDMSERIEHHAPLTIGTTLRYSLDSRWSVVSGVMYKRLASEFSRYMGSNEVTDKQTLHYVGIPLSIAYNVWNNESLYVYAMAGGEADMNVSARLNTDGVKRDIHKDRLQWSAAASMGVEYDLLPGIGLYLQPGLRYYFDNGSQVENIFKEKPLNLDLQFGLRLKIQ